MADGTARRERAEATLAVLAEHGFAPSTPDGLAGARAALERASQARPEDDAAQIQHVREWAARNRRSVA